MTPDSSAPPESNSAPTDEPTPAKAPPTAWEVVQQTVVMCLRASVIVAFCGMIMLWGYHNDQLGFPAQQYNPDDVAYLESNQAAQFHQAPLDPLFEYHEMIDLYHDQVVMNDHHSRIGSFFTYDSPGQVHQHYLSRWKREGLHIDPGEPKEGEFILIAHEPDKQEQYDMRATPRNGGLTQVYFSKNQLAENVNERPELARGGSEGLPVPKGRYEIYEIATSPGALWGKTQQYLSDTSVEGNFQYFASELQRRGWRYKNVGMPAANPTGARTGLFRKGPRSCMLNVVPTRDRGWLSIVSITYF